MKKFCDCMQGRLPCTCKPNRDAKRPEVSMGFRKLDQVADAIEFEAIMRGEHGMGTSDYWRGAAKRATDRADALYVEYLAASSKLQIMQGLAILGWAVVILMAMGV
jgi:hypothetical protein